MRNDATIDGSDSMVLADNLGRLITLAIFLFVLRPDSTPAWAIAVITVATAVSGIAAAAALGTLLYNVYRNRRNDRRAEEERRRDEERQRLADEVERERRRIVEAADLIRVRVGSGPYVYTVAQIAAAAGIAEALAEKALLLLEQQGFARRASGNTWGITQASR